MIEYEGKMYARVSEILKPFTNFDHIDPQVLANKIRIGIDTHKAIEEDINGIFPSPPADCQKYFDSYSKWKERLQPSFSMSETRLYCHEKMICGQIDALIQFPGEEQLVLVDFKTSASESPKVWPRQAHLYHYLLTQNGKTISPRFLFVKLDKYGKMPIVFQYLFNPSIRARCMTAIDDFWKSGTK